MKCKDIKGKGGEGLPSLSQENRLKENLKDGNRLNMESRFNKSSLTGIEAENLTCLTFRERTVKILVYTKVQIPQKNNIFWS